MTHLKKCPGCEVCVQAKMQAKQARRRDPDLKFLKEQPERFGQLLWADPVIIGKKEDLSRSYRGESRVVHLRCGIGAVRLPGTQSEDI